MITRWWNIVNVKTPNKGYRLNNVFQQPHTAVQSESSLFLKSLLEWLTKRDEIKQTVGKLTGETHTAVAHTSNALLEIADYCLNELGAKYVLLGKFQTDNLKSCFGQYQQLAGGKYDISLQQAFECEKKLHLLSVLKLAIKGREITLKDFECDWDAYQSNTNCGDGYPIHQIKSVYFANSKKNTTTQRQSTMFQ